MKPNRLVWIFALLILFVTISDSIMAYVSPVYINKVFDNTLIVGLILSVSSTAGILIDLIVARNLSKKNYRFYISIMVIFALLFPILFLFGPHTLPVFLLGMVIWSIYYEFRDFSKFNFVHRFLPIPEHTRAWAKLIMSQALAYVIGPTIVFFLLKISDRFPLFAAILSSVIAIFMYLVLKNLAMKVKRELPIKNVRKSTKIEFEILKTLFGRIWQIFVFGFVLVLVDVSFWTMGILLSEELKKVSYLGGLLIIIYAVPGIYSGLIADKIYFRLGKKRTMFISGLLSGIILFITASTNNIYILLLSVLFAATTYSISWVLLNALFEDFVARLGSTGNDMVTIHQLAVNSAYILGPIFFGGLATLMPLQNTFGVIGVIVAATSVTALLTVPRKIKMPQKELREDLATEHVKI
ncbi:MFS transporter [Patescibacteria group bacterium]